MLYIEKQVLYHAFSEIFPEKVLMFTPPPPVFITLVVSLLYRQARVLNFLWKGVGDE
jgi:hypothetical protein